MKIGELSAVLLLIGFVTTARFQTVGLTFKPSNKTPVPLVTPKNKAEQKAFEEQANREGKNTSVYPLAEAPPSGLGPNGQISRWTSEDVRTREGKETTQPLQANTNALKEGYFHPQNNNVAGTYGTSPNPTSNLYGTGGIPIFPGDFLSSKTGGSYTGG